jgi:glutaminyl-peptide cyclotransferase
MKMQFTLLILISTLAFACDKPANKPNTNVTTNNTNINAGNTATAMKKEVPVYTYEVVKTYKHDPKAFTEGLQFYNGFLYESTGEEGKSTLRKVELESGKVLQNYNLPREIFGEGTTVFKDKIYQLSWRNQTAFVYDMNFKLLREFKYQGEGWGLTNDGTNLIMTDSTHVIRFVNPETFEVVRTLPVIREDGKPQMWINELEYIKGELWANIWQSEKPDVLGKPNYIARIDPNSGKILGWIDLDNISPEDSGEDYENSLNGIAYDEAADRIFVTGKNWKRLFEIKIKAK